MIKKIIKVILVLVVILGITFSILNFFPKKIEAKMIEELLHELGTPNGSIYIIWCEDQGQGCYTVIPEEPV